MKKIILVCLAVLLTGCYSYVQNKTTNFNDANLSAEVSRHKTGYFHWFDLLLKNKTDSLMKVYVKCQWLESETDKPVTKPETSVFYIEPRSGARHTQKTLAVTYGYYWDCRFGYEICR